MYLGAQCFADKTMLFATACNFSNGFSIEMDGNSFSLLLTSGSSTILNSCFIVAISGNFHDGSSSTPTTPFLNTFSIVLNVFSSIESFSLRALRTFNDGRLSMRPPYPCVYRFPIYYTWTQLQRFQIQLALVLGIQMEFQQKI